MTTETQTLTAWLLERIAEDEAVALAAGADGAASWTVPDPIRESGRVVSDRATVTYDEGSPTAEDATHIARNDPARVLATCKAHRAIVEEYVKEQWVIEQGHRTDWTMAGQAARETTIRALASIYADHESFDPRWAL
jgi:hypothetical protein